MVILEEEGIYEKGMGMRVLDASNILFFDGGNRDLFIWWKFKQPYTLKVTEYTFKKHGISVFHIGEDFLLLISNPRNDSMKNDS